MTRASDDHQGERDFIIRELGSGDNTVFSEVQVVHRLINHFLDFFPVAASLYEFVNVLSGHGRGL